VPDQQEAPIPLDGSHRLKRLHTVEAAREGCVLGELGTLGLRPALGRDLRRLARSDLGAEENPLEALLHLCDRDAGRTRLQLAPLGEPALGVLASTVGLGIRVPK